MPDPGEAASGPKRFVFITDELPTTGVAGHLAANHAIIEFLISEGHQVTLLLVGARLRWPVIRYPLCPVAGPAIMRRGGLVAVRTLPALGRILAKSMLAWLPAGSRRRLAAPVSGAADAVLGKFISPAQAGWCTRFIKTARPDAVLVDTIFRAPVLAAPELADCNSVIIAHDVFYRRHAALRSAGYRLQPPELLRADEAELLNQARGIAAIQPDEAALIGGMCPQRRVFTLSMPALPCPRPDGTVRSPHRLVFIGSATLPNLDGLRWFFEAVWPLLRRWRGDKITLDLIGDCGKALPLLPEGVTRRGRITLLAPVLHQAALAIAPLRVGSGLKIKMLDYARHGLITVGTPQSLQGFAVDPRAPFIAAANATGFASAVVRQLDLPDRQDERALSYVKRHYGRRVSFAGLIGALDLAGADTAADQSVGSPLP